MVAQLLLLLAREDQQHRCQIQTEHQDDQLVVPLLLASTDDETVVLRSTDLLAFSQPATRLRSLLRERRRR